MNKPIHFRLSGISHIDIEDSYVITSTLREFLSMGEKFVLDTIGVSDRLGFLNENLKLLYKENGTLTDDRITISGFLFNLKAHRSGVILKIEIPEVRPAPNNESFVSIDFKNTVYSFVYGESYEEALNKAISQSTEFTEASLAFRKVAFANKNTLQPKIKDATLLERFVHAFQRLS